MWGMAGWSNSNDDESLGSLQAAVEHGCNFFDTAYAYGNGRTQARVFTQLQRFRRKI
jgi:aryl-alcohol dehydrogenase-like predicted oxidoreductase